MATLNKKLAKAYYKIYFKIQAIFPYTRVYKELQAKHVKKYIQKGKKGMSKLQVFWE